MAWYRHSWKFDRLDNIYYLSYFDCLDDFDPPYTNLLLYSSSWQPKCSYALVTLRITVQFAHLWCYCGRWRSQSFRCGGSTPTPFHLNAFTVHVQSIGPCFNCPLSGRSVFEIDKSTSDLEASAAVQRKKDSEPEPTSSWLHELSTSIATKAHAAAIAPLWYER